MPFSLFSPPPSPAHSPRSLTRRYTGASHRRPDLLPRRADPQPPGRRARLLDYANCAAASACYARDLDAQTTRASALLDAAVAHSKPGEKLALVLDIDETSLSNMEEMKHDDFGYIPQDFNTWVVSGKAPAIPGTLQLFNHAKSLGVTVFFITGRGESQRRASPISPPQALALAVTLPAGPAPSRALRPQATVAL